MKALTLSQPWATLVAIGAKHIETRSWYTRYRGPLAIHVAKGFSKEAQYLCFGEPFRKLLIDKYSFFRANEIYFGKHTMPLGCVIATCELVECFAIQRFQSGFRWGDGYEWIITHDERAFGDYAPGRYAWLLDNVKILPEPIPAKGRLGLWEWQERAE